MSRITYKEYMDKSGKVAFKNTGVSMLPMLKQDRDFFSLEKKGKERCRKYDVILYKRSPEKYILHRIIEVRETDYVVRGDNCSYKEYGITDADIIAVLKEFVHKGKIYSVGDFRYRTYVLIWCHTHTLRRLFYKIKQKLRGICKNEKQKEK